MNNIYRDFRVTGNILGERQGRMSENVKLKMLSDTRYVRDGQGNSQ